MNETTSPDSITPPPMKRVRFITNSEAEPGMTLAFMVQAVRSSQLFKLSAGVVLTEEIIEQLRRRQVNCFAIEVDETRSIEEISLYLVDTQEQIKAAFSMLGPDDAVARELYSSLMEYRLSFS